MKSSGLTLGAVGLLVLALLTACSSGTPKLRSISVTPSTATITKSAPSAAHRTQAAVLDTLQYTATATFSSGSPTDITSTATWSSSSPAVATISATGLATAVAPGTTTITATMTGISGTASLTVTSVVSVAVTPVNPMIAGGATEQFVATATITNPDGTMGTLDVSSDPATTWASATMGVATINSTGLATGVGAGTSVISATFGNASGNTTLTVGAPGPVSLVLTPATPNIAVSNSVAFTVQEKWSDNSLHNPPPNSVTFSSGTPATATINATTGVALGVAVGTSTITATEGALTGTATLTVVVANARFAYVANINDYTIEEYTVNAAAGTFTTPTTVAATQPQQVIVDPNGLYVYCICGIPSNQTSAVLYNVTPGTGVLTAPTPAISTVVGTGGSNRGVIDPTGQFMFVIDGNTNVVGSYSISQVDGSLTAVNSVATGNSPVDVLVDHTGKYLYVVNNVDNNVSQYSIATDGTLAPLSPATVTTTGVGPEFSTIDPANKYLYVPNNGDSSLTIFLINSNGTLAGQSKPTITGATAVGNVAVDPTNKYIYVLDSTSTTTGHLYGYNTGTGVLGAALPSSPYALTTANTDGLSPSGIAIDPTGVLVAVDNNFSNDISLLQLTTTSGALVPSATSPVLAGNAPLFVVFYIAP
jgi:6-phosphogluconolactonase (cycloisomerase 2 family)